MPEGAPGRTPCARTKVDFLSVAEPTSVKSERQRRGRGGESADARASRHRQLPRGALRADRGRRARAGPAREPVRGALVRPADPRGPGAPGGRALPARQAAGARARGRPAPGDPPDDRRAAAVEGAGREDPGPGRARGVRLPVRHARAHRGEHAEAGVDPPRARRRGARAVPPRGARAARGDAAPVRRGARAREPHAEAEPHRPAAVQRDRERLLGRDPPPREALAGEALAVALRRRGRAAVRGDLRGAAGVGRAVPRAAGRRLPREGDRVPPGDGGARQVPPALPGVPDPGAADRPRGERDELLPALSDRREAARRPRALEAAQAGLAEDDRRARGAQEERRAERPAEPSSGPVTPTAAPPPRRSKRPAKPRPG